MIMAKSDFINLNEKQRKKIKQKNPWNFPACLILVLLVKKISQLTYGPKRDTNSRSRKFGELVVKSKTKALKNKGGV